MENAWRWTDSDFVVEQQDCQWILNIGSWHTQTRECPTCQLCQIDHIKMSMAQGVLPCLDFYSAQDCPSEKDDNISVVRLRGFLNLPEGGNFWIFHVCTQQQILQLGMRCILFQSFAKTFVSTLSEGTPAWEQSDALSAPFQQTSLPPEYFRHFFVKTGGQASALDVWLSRGHCEA